MSKGISHPDFYSDLIYKPRRDKDTPNFISSGSKIVKRLRRRQYDPLTIERTIGLVLGPSTALYGPFLKHCTLTNKGVGTLWRAFSKPPQRRQVLISSPLIVSRDSFSHQTWARFQPGGAEPALFGCHYIFFCYIIFIIYALRVSIFMTFPLGWLLVCFSYIRRFIYKFLYVCPFDYRAVAGSGKVGPVNQVNHTSWVAVVAATDHPKSVRNHYIIELFCGVVCVVTCPFDISVGVGAFVIGRGQISSFFSYYEIKYV